MARAQIHTSPDARGREALRRLALRRAGGIVQRTTSRSTGSVVFLIDAEHARHTFQTCEGGRWVTYCATHGTFVQHVRKVDAVAFMPHPDEYCEACREAKHAKGEQ